MAEMTDLIQTLCDSLQSQFGSAGDGAGAGGLFLAFERLGIGLSANDFKLQAGDPGFNPAVAAQHGSTLVDFVAQIDPDGFIVPRGDLSPTLTGQYQQILGGASYGVQPAGDAALTAFLQSKGIAQRTFDESQVSVDLGQSYWTASFVPAVWYDDQDGTLWQTYSSSSTESTGTPAATPPNPTPPAFVPRTWNWRVVTPEAAPELATVRSLQAVPAAQRSTSEVFLAKMAPVQAAPSNPAVTSGPATLSEIAAPRVSALQVSTLRFAPRVAAASPMLFAGGIRSTTAVSSAASADLASAQIISLPQRAPAMRLNPLTVTNAATSAVVSSLPVQPVSSSGFVMSFQYCVVNVSRPWLSGDFLLQGNWFVPGLQAGDLSQGKYATGAQRFAFLPAKMLIIKGLNIQAQWSDADRAVAQSAASLGPFSLINSRFDQNGLTAPGMQILGWFCQVVPLLPPLADPAVVTASVGTA